MYVFYDMTNWAGTTQGHRLTPRPSSLAMPVAGGRTMMCAHIPKQTHDQLTFPYQANSQVQPRQRDPIQQA